MICCIGPLDSRHMIRQVTQLQLSLTDSDSDAARRPVTVTARVPVVRERRGGKARHRAFPHRALGLSAGQSRSRWPGITVTLGPGHTGARRARAVGPPAAARPGGPGCR
jgi:hypothetical protein